MTGMAGCDYQMAPSCPQGVTCLCRLEATAAAFGRDALGARRDAMAGPCLTTRADLEDAARARARARDLAATLSGCGDPHRRVGRCPGGLRPRPGELWAESRPPDRVRLVGQSFFELELLPYVTILEEPRGIPEEGTIAPCQPPSSHLLTEVLSKKKQLCGELRRVARGFQLAYPDGHLGIRRVDLRFRRYRQAVGAVWAAGDSCAT